MLEVLAKIEASKRKVKDANKAAKRKKKSGPAEDETGGTSSSTAPQASDAVTQAIPLVTGGSSVLPPPLTDSPAHKDKRQRVGSSSDPLKSVGFVSSDSAPSVKVDPWVGNFDIISVVTAITSPFSARDALQERGPAIILRRRLLSFLGTVLPFPISPRISRITKRLCSRLKRREKHLLPG